MSDEWLHLSKLVLAWRETGVQFLPSTVVANGLACECSYTIFGLGVCDLALDTLFLVHYPNCPFLE